MPNVPAKLLIVDDTVVNIRLLSSILHSQGYELYTAENGRQALEVLKQQKYKLDLLLLDIMMPEMDGYEVCAYLKSQAQMRHIPVMFISTLDSVEDKVKAFKVGAADYIPRPFQSEEVLMRVRNQLMLRSLQRQLKISNQKLAHANQELEKTNLALSQANAKLETTYQEVAQRNQELTQNSQGLTQRHQELLYNQENLKQENDKLERQVERRTAALNQLNEACMRFVPQAMLNLLNRPKVAQLQAGAQINTSLNLLFLNAHQLNASSLESTNAWLAHINPLIHQYDGFVHHYMNSQLLAVFPGHAEDTLQAALGIQKIARQQADIDVCISLHSADMWLGIVGDEHHLQYSLEPNWVFFMQWLEQLGYRFGSRIICSAAIFEPIEQHMRYACRCLGCLQTPKEQSLAFYEVFTEDDDSKDHKIRLKEHFEEAVRNYQQKNCRNGIRF